MAKKKAPPKDLIIFGPDPNAPFDPVLYSFNEKPLTTASAEEGKLVMGSPAAGHTGKPVRKTKKKR